MFIFNGLLSNCYNYIILIDYHILIENFKLDNDDIITSSYKIQMLIYVNIKKSVHYMSFYINYYYYYYYYYYYFGN